MRTAAALGMNETSMPVITLIGIGMERDTIVRKEATQLAEQWGHNLFFLTHGDNDDQVVEKAYLYLLEKINDTRLRQTPALAPVAYQPKPPRRLWMRRITGRILPGSVLRLFTK